MSVPVTTAAGVRKVVGDTGASSTSPSRGAELFRFVSEHKFTSCLELGFAHGVSTVYIAAALESNGTGSLTSIDLPSAHDRSPSANELLARSGLSHRVSLVFDPDSYVWWLRKRLRECWHEGAIAPVYDFVFIDGAHTWDTDALAFSLVDRVLVPGGWILFDDLDWAPTDPTFSDVPADTRGIAHVREIWELLVRTSRNYDVLRTDGAWGYAQKSLVPCPPVQTVVKHELMAQARALARMVRRRIKDDT